MGETKRDVPLNVRIIADELAKPEPDTVTCLPEGPLPGVSVICDVTVYTADA